MMWVNFIMFIAIQVGLLLVMTLLPDRVEYSPVEDWPAIVVLALWMAVSFVICVKIWRNEIAKKSVRNRFYLAVLPVFIIIYISFVIGEFVLSPRAALLAILALAFFFIPLLVTALLYRIENPYGVDLITIPNYARLTGLLALCLLLVYGGWLWASNWNDGVAEFVEEKRVYAETAFRNFEYCIGRSGGPERLDAISQGRFTWRITDVEILPNQRYFAKVQFYTWMRIPTYAVAFRGAVGEESCPPPLMHRLYPLRTGATMAPTRHSSGNYI